MADKFVGVLSAKNCKHTVDLCLRSTKDVLDEYIIYDNNSTDNTLNVIKDTVYEYDLDAQVYQKKGFSGDIYTKAIREADGYAVRLESDQVYFKDRLRECLNEAEYDNHVIAQSYFIRNRLDMTRREAPVNEPHSTIYPPGCNIQIRHSSHLPIANEVDNEWYKSPISVNLNIGPPAERLRWWHRKESNWSRRSQLNIPEHMRLPDTEPPYRDHMSMSEYVWRLREHNKGSVKYDWDGKTLRDIGKDYIEWDIEHNCTLCDSPLPELVKDNKQRFEKYYV